MGTEGLKIGQVKKWVTRSLGKKRAHWQRSRGEPLKPGVEGGGRARRRGYRAPGGWSAGGVEGPDGEPQRGLHSVWLLMRKYPAQDKPEGREPGLGSVWGAQVRPTVP